MLCCETRLLHFASSYVEPRLLLQILLPHSSALAPSRLRFISHGDGSIQLPIV